MSQKTEKVDVNKWEKIPCECGEFAEKGKVKFKEYKVRGWVCKKCGKEYIHPKDSARISALEKLKKGTAVKVGTLGQSFIIRIPKEMAELYKIEKGEKVKLVPEDLKKIEILV